MAKNFITVNFELWPPDKLKTWFVPQNFLRIININKTIISVSKQDEMIKSDICGVNLSVTSFKS